MSGPDPLRILDLAQSRAGAVIAAIHAEDWSLSTPCSEWSVRDVANKLVASTWTFTCFARRLRPEPPWDLVHPAEVLGEDPYGTYVTAAAECRHAWRAPDALVGTAPSTVGDFPAKAVLNARIFDTTVLSWDLARACRLDHGIDDEQAAYVLRVASALVPTVRSVNPARYRQPEELGEDRPLTERMIAATGRDPAWQPPSPPGLRCSAPSHLVTSPGHLVTWSPGHLVGVHLVTLVTWSARLTISR